MASAKYPRTLYKSPGTQELVSKKVKYTYDSLVVNNEKEHDTAVEMGYIDSFEDAILNMPTKAKAKAPAVKVVKDEKTVQEEEGF